MKYVCLFFALLIGTSVIAQEKFFTRTGHVSFFSEAALENIEAHNHQVTSILNVENGDLVFSILMKGFEFDKALMQEHFNESYVESEKFPKASFKGSIENFESLDLAKDGTYEVTVSGDIDLHGVTKNYKTQGTIIKKGDKMDAKTKFNIKVADHNVKIPAGKLDNISEIVEITVDMNYAPYGK
jgi:hypothetical protein